MQFMKQQQIHIINKRENNQMSFSKSNRMKNMKASTFQTARMRTRIEGGANNEEFTLKPNAQPKTNDKCNKTAPICINKLKEGAQLTFK